jgi:predicted secreted hydrolase
MHRRQQALPGVNGLRRRQLLGAAAATTTGMLGLTDLPAHAAQALAAMPKVAQARPLVFPRDAGAHPEFKTEWWYLTGWATAVGAPSQAPAYGFQITFFRSRVDGTQNMQSRLAARQLLFAHAAITDVQAQHLQHDQRIARWSGEPPGHNPADRASASLQDSGVVLGDWSLLRQGADLQAQVVTDAFAMQLRCANTQPVLLQGDAGLSRKGPQPQQTSYYYSLPQLRVSGTLTAHGKPIEIRGTAWLDHEWSEEVLPEGAQGWDWLGINLLDGSALTAFRLRDAHGAALWDGGSFRSGQTLYTFRHGEVIFKPLRSWRSPASGASYPVEWLVRTPADFYTVKALVDNQELDSSNSTGAIYWEGLCEVWDSNNRLVGRGYLEMTGYAAALKI